MAETRKVSIKAYVVGRWNNEKNRCEYLTDMGHNGWTFNIDSACLVNANPCTKRLKEWSNPHCPAFVCKVFYSYVTNGWINAYVKKIPCKLNHWQKLEGMMQI